ncbi:hypothetical protein WN944_009349 [Citrus x changshan-huyou]|uniref:Uncharacterized protein n=1 Tax=Citrus x changshan-huyou TaxID=2935761 RepID=A0AAP0MS17_9ROSI
MTSSHVGINIELKLKTTFLYQQSVGSTGNGVPLSDLTGFAPQFESQGSHLCWENLCLPVRVGTSSLGCAIAALVATYGADDIAWSNCGLEWKKLSKLFVDTMISNASLDASYGPRKQESLRAVVWRWHACIDEGTSLGAELTFKLAELMVLMGTPNIF